MSRGTNDQRVRFLLAIVSSSSAPRLPPFTRENDCDREASAEILSPLRTSLMCSAVAAAPSYPCCCKTRQAVAEPSFETVRRFLQKENIKLVEETRSDLKRLPEFF